MDQKRKVEKRINGEWVEIPFSDIKKDDVIRLFEPDGQPVSNDGNTVFVTTSDSYLNSKDVLTVDVE